MNGWIKRLLFLITVCCFLIVVSPPSFSQESENPPELEVEVEIGPKFGEKEKDQQGVFNCVTSSFGDKFPFDLVYYSGADDVGKCPKLEIFNNTYDACFVVDIYDRIRPAILGGLVIYAVFHL
ncbi:MAG: hypothetical protein QNJ42_18695 [Crocosphaera sp.]|nr:hypothetical protein [Crocosphaera sp.]